MAKATAENRAIQIKRNVYRADIHWLVRWRGTMLLTLAMPFLLAAGLFLQSAPDAFGQTKLSQEGLTDAGIATLCQQIETAQRALGAAPRYRGEVDKFYSSLDYRLAWIQNGEPSKQANAVIGLLRDADQKGLVPEDYDGPSWTDRLNDLERKATEGEYIRFDLALTVSSMRYISDLNVGRVNPRAVSFALDTPAPTYDLAEFLRQRIIRADDVIAAMEAVEPPFPGYKRTLAALNTYRALARTTDAQPLPVERKTVAPGQNYPGLPQLRRQLMLLGDLPSSVEAPGGTIYQGAVVDAVKRFQARHGLEPHGKLDAQTMAALNVPLGSRIEQLQLTLERWRWVPHQLELPLVVVNIPEFKLHAIDESYHWVFSQKVVVGRAYRHKTPVFMGQMHSIIFRPYWDVPLSIQRAELIPHLESDPLYLEKHGYEIVDRNRSVVHAPGMDQATIERLRSGALAIRQRPGGENALGLIKFEFPNQFDVYMHGTPATELFSRSRRDFSHGCIRLEDPAALAKWILGDDPKWTLDAIRAAMNGDRTFTVSLVHPMPVLIIYGTAVVQENGEVDFLPDVYGYDASLKAALAEQRLHAEQAQ